MAATEQRLPLRGFENLERTAVGSTIHAAAK
jgi:hypothetical protein